MAPKKDSKVSFAPGSKDEPKFQIPLPPPPSTKHALQRLQSPSRGLSMIFHAAGLSSFAASFKYLVDFPNAIERNDAYGWHFQYLTIIGLALATITFAFGSLSDWTLSPTLFRVKNVLGVCSAPLAVLIGCLYWGLKLYDESLVTPPEINLDPLADLGFHLAPSLFLSLDLLLLSPPWNIDFSAAMILSSALAGLYWVWVEHCQSHNGWYPYPLFDLLDTWPRAGVFVGSAALMAVWTVGLKGVYGVINGRDIGGMQRKKVVKMSK